MFISLKAFCMNPEMRGPRENYLCTASQCPPIQTEVRGLLLPLSVTPRSEG